jgi:hypothetical protein
MKKQYDLKGSCVCGKVEYLVNYKPLFTQACNCNNCKKSTGSSFFSIKAKTWSEENLCRIK